jgi:hypothetical protein
MKNAFIHTGQGNRGERSKIEAVNENMLMYWRCPGDDKE